MILCIYILNITNFTKIKNNSILYYHLVFFNNTFVFSKAQTEVHKMKKLNIALLGLGTVGSGVVKIIEENRQQIQDTLNKDIVIKHILVRDKSKRDR